MIYYKHIEAQYNPLKNCNTVKIGSYNDFKKNYGESDIADKLEGIWEYTFEPNVNFSMHSEYFHKFFLANHIKIQNCLNVTIENADLHNTINGLNVFSKIHNASFDARTTNKIDFIKNSKMDIKIKAPNTYIFCLTTNPTPPKNSNYDDYYMMNKKNIFQFAQYLSKIILKNTKNNCEYAEPINNYVPNKLRCVPKIVTCIYENFDDFKTNYICAEKIFNSPQKIYYLKREKFSYQQETRILFQLCYDNLILDAPEDSLILDFPNFLKKDLINEKEIATPA